MMAKQDVRVAESCCQLEASHCHGMASNYKSPESHPKSIQVICPFSVKWLFHVVQGSGTAVCVAVETLQGLLSALHFSSESPFASDASRLQ